MGYICKIANIDEIIQRWDDLIIQNPDNESWKVWKQQTIEAFNNQTQIVYYGILDNKIISEATAVISVVDENKNQLVNNKMAYLMAFRTDSQYQNQGYFSKLYRYMENDLKKRHFSHLTIGVEPTEIKNKQIYNKWGFNTLIKTATETYPNGETIEVEYYLKQLY